MNAPRRWQELTAAELLDAFNALTPTQVAVALNLRISRGRNAGEPNRTAVLALIHDGRLPVVDPRQPITRWTVSTAAVRRYLDGGRGDARIGQVIDLTRSAS